jgi:hypothetical protein
MTVDFGQPSQKIIAKLLRAAQTPKTEINRFIFFTSSFFKPRG